MRRAVAVGARSSAFAVMLSNGSVNRCAMPSSSTPAAVTTSTQRRWNINADGSTFKPKGTALASMGLPMNEKMEEQFNMLAKTAHQTNNLRDAISLYDRVLRFRRQKHGDCHSQVAGTLHNIARVYIDLRDHKRAEMTLVEACAIYERTEGKDSFKYADSQGLLAVCYRDMTLYDDAEACFKASIKAYRDHTYNHALDTWIPTDSTPPAQPNLHPLSAVAHLLSDAATLFLQQNQVDRAAAFLEDALEIRRWLYSSNSKFKPIIAQTLSKLSEVRRAQANINAAEILINEALDLCIETMGRDSPATAATYASKGNVLAAKQLYSQALKCYQEAATTYALAFGKQSPLVASELLHIGRMHEMLTQIDEAEKNYNKCLEMTKDVLGPEHVQCADASAYIAGLMMKKTKYDKAVPLLRDAIRIRSRVNKNDPALVFVYHRLGDALSAMGDPEAEAHFLQSIELHRQLNTDSQRLLMTDCLDDLGLHYIQFKHLDKAEEVLKEALEIRHKLLGNVHPTVAYSYSNMAVLQLARQQYKESETSCKMALKVYEESKADQKLSVADVLMTLGQAQHGIGDLQAAYANHEKSLVMRRTAGELADISVAESLNEMAKVCIDLKKMSEASDYLAEAFKIADKYNHAGSRIKQELEKTQKLFQRDTVAIPPTSAAAGPNPIEGVIPAAAP